MKSPADTPLVFCPDSYTGEGYVLDQEEQETRKKLAKGKKQRDRTEV